MSKNAASYKIRQVIDLTGASEFLLRVWENRYSAFTPVRTKTGRRLYSETDVLKARALLALTQQGVRVGEVAQLSLTELNKILSQNSENKVEADDDPLVKKIMAKANQFMGYDVHNLILQEKKARQPLDWIHDLVVPVLFEMGRQVDNGHFSIAQEHIFSAIIKEHLAFRTNRKIPSRSGPRIVFAAPEGDFHDIGLLLAAHIATELEANTLFLGAHMPKTELAAVCVRYKATHVLLSSTVDKKEGAKDDLLKYLNFLDRTLDSKVTLWLAGRATLKYSLSLRRPFKTFNSFDAFEVEVKKCLK